jgi:hypothetical protein
MKLLLKILKSSLEILFHKCSPKLPLPQQLNKIKVKKKDMLFSFRLLVEVQLAITKYIIFIRDFFLNNLMVYINNGQINKNQI